MGRRLSRARATLRMIASILPQGAPDPRVVKARLPTSWFTKRGPGVEANAVRAFRSMTPEQKELAIARGWVPAWWGRLTKKGTLICSKR